MTDRPGHRSRRCSLGLGMCLAVAMAGWAVGQGPSAGAEMRAPHPRTLTCTATARARPVKQTGGNSTLITVICDAGVAYVKFRGSPLGSGFDTASPIWGPARWAVSFSPPWVIYSVPTAAYAGQKLRFFIDWADVSPAGLASSSRGRSLRHRSRW